MNKIITIKENIIFNSLYRRGKSIVAKQIVLYYKENNLNINRFGITVSKKIGTSVERNRAKRIVRESLRIFGDDIVKGYDIIIVCRQAINSCKRQDLDRAMWYVLNKANIVSKKKNKALS